jgi:hypothetical protein
MAVISCENYIIFTELWKFNKQLDDKLEEIQELSEKLNSIYDFILPKDIELSGQIMIEYDDTKSIQENIKHLSELNIEVE